MHIVSDVSGQLAKDKTTVDALMQCFQWDRKWGTKIRAMEIIDEMEPTNGEFMQELLDILITQAIWIPV